MTVKKCVEPRVQSVPNDEVERRGDAQTSNEADLSRSSTPSLAQRRYYPSARSNRLVRCTCGAQAKRDASKLQDLSSPSKQAVFYPRARRGSDRHRKYTEAHWQKRHHRGDNRALPPRDQQKAKTAYDERGADNSSEPHNQQNELARGSREKCSATKVPRHV